MKRILLVGAGHAHLVVLRSLKQSPLYGASIILVTPTPLQIYSGMLPGVIAGHYALREAQVDVAALAGYVELVQSEVASIDLERRVAKLAGGVEIEYEYASLNVGSLVDWSIPGAREHALTVKPFQEFIDRLGAPRRVAIAGAGAAGAELAMALRHAGAQVTLYSEQKSISERVVRALRHRGVDFRPGMPVTAIEPGPVVIAGTTHQEFERVVLATGAVPLPWLRASGLAADERGFALVQPTLQSQSHPEIFAAGDCATLRDSPHPKSGVYSMRHGQVLAHNLRNLVEGKPLVPYRPQPRALSILTCGGRYAIAERGEWSAEGRWAWWWKDWIDRRWMRSLENRNK